MRVIEGREDSAMPRRLWRALAMVTVMATLSAPFVPAPVMAAEPVADETTTADATSTVNHTLFAGLLLVAGSVLVVPRRNRRSGAGRTKKSDERLTRHWWA